MSTTTATSTKAKRTSKGKARRVVDPAQRRAEAEALQASIATQVEALRESAQWVTFLEFSRAFHHYSVGNLLLILAQCPHATQVAGYRTWQKLNRQVSKGQRGIRIFGGRAIQTTTTDEATGEESTTRAVRFFPVSVFDQSQTEVIDPQIPDPQSIAAHLDGADPDGICQAVTAYLIGRGWSVEREPIPGGTNGYSTADGTRRVVIDADLSPAQAAKTALHEAAHVLMHIDTDQDQDDEDQDDEDQDDENGDENGDDEGKQSAAADYHQHRGIYETEAESVAYVVAGLLGLDTSAYSIGYVAGWSKADTDVIKSTATRVLATSHTLAEALAPTSEDTD